ncbi:MAG: tetratricopeptide repeat protein [Aquabacterium sp.]|uniref:tetratricopeptide repeat protein n=1 Tax=Aquabacterium sp. TaxID=1872578 RepID=UPI0025BC043D|nr:tetratricopeptide repeat protein [Aquabacterium sp.]MBI3382041.1 tetratricopeptide repeat protein [Aquabacterium sp.]
MRFADGLWRTAAVALMVGMTGCAWTNAQRKSLMGAPASPSASTASTASQIDGHVPTEALPSAAEQRAFDEATRALRAGNTALAERGFRALARANPALAGPHANLGLMQRQAGKLAESAQELELAVKLSPNQALYLNQLGITYRQQGQFDKAREAYEKAIALNDRYAEAILNLGILYDLYLAEPGRALTQYERYLALTPSGDATVKKWVAELKNRKPASSHAAGKDKS